jgi:hypothetical protein
MGMAGLPSKKSDTERLDSIFQSMSEDIQGSFGIMGGI